MVVSKNIYKENCWVTSCENLSLSESLPYIMNLDKLDNCNVCMELYNSDIRPRCLPCGHNLCSFCVDKFIIEGAITCPHCKKKHQSTCASDFPQNYGMEALIAELRKAKVWGTVKSKPQYDILPQSQVGSKWQELFKEEKDGLKKLIQSSQEEHSEMLKFATFLQKRKKNHEDILPKVSVLLHRNEKVVGLIDTDSKILDSSLMEGEQLRRKASETLRKYHNVTRREDILSGSDEIGQCYETVVEWRTRSQKKIPNANTITYSDKVLRETTAALSLVSLEDEDSAEVLLEESQAHLPVMEKLEMVRGHDCISVKELQFMLYIRGLMENGHLYAVQSESGRSRWAKVSFGNEKMYLHCFQDTKPPAKIKTIQFSDLTGTMKKETSITFMDLSWEGTVQGRLHIGVSPSTPLASHFRLLCTGEHGPSYLQSNFLEVVNKNDGADERVYGGDYQANDGSEGAPVLKGLKPKKNCYKRREIEGIVFTRYHANDDPRIAQFGIVTGTGSDFMSCGVFGQVQDGLEILRAATRLDSIQSVRIEDCGIVLPI